MAGPVQQALSQRVRCAFCKGFSSPLAAGYASIKAMVHFGGPDGCPYPQVHAGHGLERQTPQAAPEVLAAAGLGLIGPVIWTSRGGQVSGHAQPGGPRRSARPMSADPRRPARATDLTD